MMKYDITAHSLAMGDGRGGNVENVYWSRIIMGHLTGKPVMFLNVVLGMY